MNAVKYDVVANCVANYMASHLQLHFSVYTVLLLISFSFFTGLHTCTPLHLQLVTN